jgi:hypothetical protein
MTAGATAAAAASMRAQKRIIQTLRDANAFSDATAIALHPPRMIQRGALRRLVRHGAVLQTADETYWLDEAALIEMKKLRTSRIILTLFGLAALLIVVSAVSIAKADTPQTPALRPDQVEFRGLYKELVETNTTLSEGSCTLAAQRMAARMSAAGYSDADARVVIPEDQPKFGSLIATLRGTDASAPAMLLLAHIDVVEARRADWERDPFALVEENGFFYARGASDDKAEASVWVDSLIRLKQQGFQPRRTIKLALTCGEETNDNWTASSGCWSTTRDVAGRFRPERGRGAVSWMRTPTASPSTSRPERRSIRTIRWS